MTNRRPISRYRSRRCQVERLEDRYLLSAQPVINEFLASNDGLVLDQDGVDSDFIELYNQGDQNVDLAGWYLTDDHADLTKWQFPARSLVPGQYLVVYASGKDRAIAGSELHTNFSIDVEGEYLGLVLPDGVTIASEFTPEFPTQQENVSYGISGQNVSTQLIGIGTPVKAFVPTNSSLGTTWTSPSFIDSSWQNGTASVGFSEDVTPPASTTALAIDFNDRASSGTTQSGFSSFVLNAGSETQFDSTTRTFGSINVTLTDVSGLGIEDRVRSTPTNSGAFTESLLLRDFVFSKDNAGTSGMDVVVSGLVPQQIYTLTGWSFDVSTTGLHTSNWKANGIFADESYTFDGSVLPTSNDTYKFGVVVAADATGKITLEGRRDASTTSFAVFLNALKIVTGDTLSPPATVDDILRVDFNTRTGGEAGTANTEPGYSTMSLDSNGSNFGKYAVTLSTYNGGSFDDRDRDTPSDSGNFTLNQVYDDFIYTTGAAGSGMEILVTGLAPNTSYDVVLRSYDGTITNSRSAIWSEVSGSSAVTFANPYTWNGTPAPASNDAYAIRATLTSSASGTLKLRGVQTTADRSVVVNSLELTRASFDSIIGLDLQSAMLNTASSAYIRVPFSVANVATVSKLLLDMRYDSGFVVYLNGIEVARRNAPTVAGTPPAFNAAATLERSDVEALTTETIDISAFKNLLVAGIGNVLAIQGLNSAPTSADFLIAPTLRAEQVTAGSLRYFTTPTPGAPNGTGVVDFVAPVVVSQAHGFQNAPFMLSLQSATADAAVYYTYDGSAPSPTNPSAHLYQSPFQINRTTIFRTAAFKTDLEPSPISTETYIFLEDVLTQTIDPSNPANNPYGLAYPTLWQANAPGDYNVDPNIVAQWNDNNPNNNDYGIREGLLSIPTISIVMDQDDLWNSTTGIYPNATSLGDDWRRLASIEYIDPATGENFQYNVGIQMHGQAGRDNVRTKKHSMRIIFNSEFDGPGRLEFPLFDNTEFADINTIVLRASFTDSFATRTQTNRYSPVDATYMRDVWMRDTQNAMGSLSASSTYVHLYINGLYWGMYDPTERPDDAFMASHIGGNEEDWDIIRDANELSRGNADAWNAMYSLARTITSAPNPDTVYWQLQGRNANGTVNSALPVYLDVENLIDYMLLHIYSGVEDWPGHNWIAGRDRVNPSTGFQFYAWDQEIALDNLFRDRTDVSNQYTPAELYALLRNSPEFKLQFADRVQKFLFNGGALTTATNQARWNARAAQIEKAIIGESARWGDARTGEVVNVPPTTTVPLMTVDEWRANVAQVNTYFDQNRSLVLSRLNTHGLFPTLGAPLLNQFGGDVDPGFQLTLTKPPGSPGSATIYYTLDGSDTRLPGGAISPSAVAFSGPLTIDDPTRVLARSLNGTTWSPVVDATFLIATELPGDYDGNQLVDQADYQLWRAYNGATSGVGLQADGNRNGVVDAADYVLWRKNLGRSSIGFTFNTINQTYSQNFNLFQGTDPSLPAHFMVTADSGLDIFRGEFDSRSSSASSFTGFMATTSDGLDYSLSWRENTGAANLADGRVLFALTNNTGQPINAFNFSYDVEAWVNGRRDNQVRFKYDVYADNAAAQTAAGRYAFATDIVATPNPHHTPIAANTDEFVLDGKLAANRVTVSGQVDLSTLLIDTANPGLGAFGALLPGQTAYFRWQISNGALTNGNRSALGIDNFELTALASAGGAAVGMAVPDSYGTTAANAPPLGIATTLFPTAPPTTDIRSVALASFLDSYAAKSSTPSRNSVPTTPIATLQIASRDDLLLIELAYDTYHAQSTNGGDSLGSDSSKVQYEDESHAGDFESLAMLLAAID